ncbi:NAD-dependent epimerase/dehydratase family protein [Pyxidicoccus fallax]|uniref:NAD-dependent epimerase/dehydratase family protein n=2 Tax=Pyxidicoccus fallax TaxID=394095 RepID=A0A848LGR0_9BACT|nr:NAD-dependent epimerase/dehydratase family protein [Pyxidicoccus fallax]NPC81963.1 NAD-dependent epimerase/dehydratase family protein [Pyxidicoccus fallax]
MGSGAGRGTGLRTSRVGLVQDFAPGEHGIVEAALADLKVLGVRELRTRVSWAEALTPEGARWYRWLMRRLSQDVCVLPCLVGTPSAANQDPKAFGDFVEGFLAEHGRFVEWVELWDEPCSLASYDWRMDPTWESFSALVAEGARRAHAAGKRVVLGGMSPVDPLWLNLVLERVGPDALDAVGVHGWPDTHDTPWTGWDAWLEPVRDVLGRHGSRAEVWITAAGYSTWRHGERRQVAEFLDAAAAPVARMYWDGLYDAGSVEDVVPEGADERDLYLGLKRADGGMKLLYRLWAESGLVGLAEGLRQLAQPRGVRPERQVVVFGGAGFIGCNVANSYLEEGRRVLVYDNLSRPGVEKNLRWLKERHGDRLDVEVADIRDAASVRRAVRHAGEVFHFGAQVAVTTSLDAPTHDFEVNARGTFNVLEALRDMETPAPLVFTSTNKVYGGLPGLRFVAGEHRYEPLDPDIRAQGISERCSLDFESPYGCSKGTADQYVLDWARSFGLRATVFRMSCIYGPRQFGTEDQGWVAHFLIRALKGQPITLYGDGMQVRDVLFVEDLVRAFRLAQARMDEVSGEAFNIGGGPTRAISLLELLELIEELVGHRPDVRHEDWRTGDQRYYVSDTRKFQAATGWAPQVGVREGVTRLLGWLGEMLERRAPRQSVSREPLALETFAG